MPNDQLELLKLLYERAGALSGHWNLYIAVALGGIGLLASGRRFAQQARIKLVLTLGFVLFALSNLDAILRVNHERQALLKMIDSQYLLAAHPAVGRPDWQFITFHLTLDTLVVLAVWFVRWYIPEPSNAATMRSNADTNKH